MGAFTPRPRYTHLCGTIYVPDFEPESSHTCPTHQRTCWPTVERDGRLYSARMEGVIEDCTPSFALPPCRTQKPFLAWITDLSKGGLVIAEETICLNGFAPAKTLPFTWTPMSIQPESTPKTICFRGNCATYNVLTLNKKGFVELLRKQCSNKGIHILGLQETRDKCSKLWKGGNYIRFSAASKHGQGGLQLWISRETPFLFDGNRSLPFSHTACTVRCATHELLIVNYNEHGLNITFVVGHAPHSQKEGNSEWWDRLQKEMRQLPASTQVILLFDANCRMHLFNDDHCGPFGPPQNEQHQDCSELFHQILHEHSLFLPSSFEQCHRGSHYTWQIGAAKARLDYVGLPKWWKDHFVRTWVETDISNNFFSHDHSMVLSQIEVPLCAERHLKIRRCAFDRSAIMTEKGKQICKRLMMEAPVVPHETDPSIHCQILEDYFQTVLPRHFPFDRRKKKKSYIQDNTYAHVLNLRCQRGELRQCNGQQERKLLFASFFAWKSLKKDHYKQTCTSLLQEVDNLHMHIATLVHQIGRQRSLLHACLKNDHKRNAGRIAEDCAQAPPGQLFSALKPLLPKHRRGLFSAEHLPGLCNSEGRPANTPEETAEIFQDYFGKAESGVMVEPAVFVDDFLQSQKMTVAKVIDKANTISLEDVSTLHRIEHKLRRLKLGKASGPDSLPTEMFRAAPVECARLYFSLFLKSTMFGADPIQWRGGCVKPIFKRGDPKQASSWRNILISSTPAKVAHSLIRDSLDRAYQHHHDDCQFGGIRGAAITVPTLSLRSFQTICRTAGINHALIFVDGVEAFYRLIREVCMACHDLSTLEAKLDAHGFLRHTRMRSSPTLRKPQHFVVKGLHHIWKK